MDILITDVTEMSGSVYCVAGWDAAANRMIRPLPNGQNWSAALLTQHGIAPGVTVRVTPRGTSNGAFPHRTEDTPIDPASIAIVPGGPAVPQVAADLNTGFGGYLKWNSEWQNVKQGVHVNPGAQCSSLVGLEIPMANLNFSEAFGKLKATIHDGVAVYQFTVSSKLLKEAWRAGGLVGVNNALPTRASAHVRVGLARPYDNPPRCYAMLNGVL